MDNTTLIVGLILAVLLIYVIQRIASLGKRLDAMETPGEAAPALQPVYQAPAAITAAGDEEVDIAAAVAAVMMLLDNEAAPAGEDGLVVRRIRREGVRAPKWRLYDANQ